MWTAVLIRHLSASYILKSAGPCLGPSPRSLLGSIHPAAQNAGAEGLPIGSAHSRIQLAWMTYTKIGNNKLLLNKVKDHAFENMMDEEKKLATVRRIIAILQQHPRGRVIYRYMIRKGKAVGLIKPQMMNDVLKKYPRIIEIYKGPDDRKLCVRLTEAAVELLQEERELREKLVPSAIDRLRKVLTMCSSKTLPIDSISHLKLDLGLPDDFRQSVIESNPQFFKIIDHGEEAPPSVALVVWDPALAITDVEKKRQKEALEKRFNDQEIKKRAFSFLINHPPSFKITKRYRNQLKEWQELPYRHPYEDCTDLGLKSAEAFKRAVAVIHEYLHITVEKRTKLERISYLRQELMLPQKVGNLVLQHPGIFYYSVKGTGHTIFLREAYSKGQLIEKNPLHTVREKFMEFIRVGRKNINQQWKQEIRDEDQELARAEKDACCPPVGSLVMGKAGGAEKGEELEEFWSEDFDDEGRPFEVWDIMHDL